MDLTKITLSQAEVDEDYLDSEEFRERKAQEDAAMDAMPEQERIEQFGCACSWWRVRHHCATFTYVQEGNVIRLRRVPVLTDGEVEKE